MKMKLFCIPHAGGSASTYSLWRNMLDPDIILHPIELAGRGSRFGEAFYKSWEEAIEDVYKKIIYNLKPNEQYAIYGHSMGSWIAYEVLKCICKKSMPQPKHVFFSGNSPAFMESKEEKIGNLPDADFIKKIVDMGDTPIEVFGEETIQYFLPPLKHDYQLVESYEHRYENIDFKGGIHVYYGAKDVMTRDELEQWSRYNHSEFELTEFPSGHMFIKDCYKKVVNRINLVLT